MSVIITYQEVKSLVENKLINRTESRSYEELSEYLFGEGQCFNESEVRKRMYGMKRLIEIIENNKASANVATRILSLSDFHIPFNLPLETFKEYSGKVDVLVLNGDIEDCQSCSKFPKNYRVNIDEEMVMTRTFIISLINMIKPKTVYIVKGNHEYRLGRYLSDRLNEDLLSIMPETPMDLIVNEGFNVRDYINKTKIWYTPLSDVYKEQGIDIIYTGDWYTKIGKTIFVHPLTYSTAMLKTTEKAVNYFLRTDRDFDCIVMAHTHKLGSYIQGNIRMYEQGCLCDLSKITYQDGYLTIPQQNGFIYMCQDKDGNIIDDCTKLVNL